MRNKFSQGELEAETIRLKSNSDVLLEADSQIFEAKEAVKNLRRGLNELKVNEAKLQDDNWIRQQKLEELM
jgi:hypothetical protein